MASPQPRYEEAGDPPATAAPDARWAAVERIAASSSFARSGRLRAFLVYIVQRAMENRPEEITEQQIGVHVFGRNPGYSSAEDNIVRITARQLRQRLAVYYHEEGRSDSLRIEVPKGGYVPVFQSAPPREAEPAFPAPVLTPEITPGAPQSQRAGRPGWLPALCFLLLGALLALGVERVLEAVRLRGTATDALWRSLFVDGQGTIFVTGDAGLNMFNNQLRAPRQLSLSDYASGSYLLSPAARSPQFAGAVIASRRYVTVVDLTVADHLSRLGRVHEGGYELRFPRDISAEDLRNRNVILTGAAVYNPWVELFDRGLSFHLEYDGTANRMYVENRRPLQGESPIYELPSSMESEGFGYIALTGNLEGNGKVLLIEGTTMLGVDAASSFLFNDARMAPLIARAGRRHGQLASFEILLESSFLKDHSTETRILATHLYP